MSFPLRQIGVFTNATIIIPSPEGSLREPWLNIQTGETTVNIQLGKDSVNQLFLIAEDLHRAIEAARARR